MSALAQTKVGPARVIPRALLCLAAGAVFLVLAGPLAALLWRSLPGLPERGIPLPALEALKLSLITATVTVAVSVLIGSPTAYLLARRRFPGRGILNTIIDLPMVLPPAVAGIALLMAFGRSGILGPTLAGLGISLPFTTAAVVIAQIFVSMPFYIRAARTGFESVDCRLEEMASVLGASGWRVFREITLPLARRGCLAGAVMTWTRALGEFGATIMFAGNFPGRTQTMPLAVYSGLQEDLVSALILASILLLVSLGILMALRLIGGRRLFNV